MIAGAVHDLAASQPAPSAPFDACIIGAGAAGSYLAKRLSGLGMRVALVEAGGLRCAPEVSDCFRPEFGEAVYSGATLGRAFGLGGSTSRWGALLAPHSEVDAVPGGDSVGGWSRLVGEVRRCAPTVLRGLGWRGELDFERLWRAPSTLPESIRASDELSAVEALFLPFRRKNLAWLVESARGGSGGGSIEIFVNAVVARWAVRTVGVDQPVVESIEARHARGNAVRIVARNFILAAGALESTRSMLELRESLPEGALRGADSIGRGLGDHLSVSIGDFRGQELAEAKRQFGPVFAGSWMRTSRLLAARRSSEEPRSFTHVIFDYQSPAFLVAKECLQALQARRAPRVSAADAIRGIGGLARMAWERFAHARLHLGLDCEAHLQLDLEQTVSDRNRVLLSDGPLDSVGRRSMRIDWAIRESDLSAIDLLRERYLHAWARNPDLPRVEPRPLDLMATKPHDAYHPVGTLRMGSGDDAVVDCELETRGLPRLFVVSTAVFPSAGTANPTFSMLCLAEALAQRLARTG
jgi:choline dehydrogenase-like flavoprotein